MDSWLTSFAKKQKEVVGQYLTYNPRHKLLIVLEDDMQSRADVVDFGRSLSVWIASQDRKKGTFQFLLQQEIDNIMKKSIRTVEGWGECRFICNIGILFEPAVELSPLQFIKKYSKDCLLVLYWNGILKDHRLHLPDEDSNCVIDLTGINYLFI